MLGFATKCWTWRQHLGFCDKATTRHCDNEVRRTVCATQTQEKWPPPPQSKFSLDTIFSGNVICDNFVCLLKQCEILSQQLSRVPMQLWKSIAIYGRNSQCLILRSGKPFFWWRQTECPVSSGILYTVGTFWQYWILSWDDKYFMSTSIKVVYHGKTNPRHLQQFIKNVLSCQIGVLIVQWNPQN